MNKKLILLLLFIMMSVITFAQKESIKDRLAKVNNDTVQYIKNYIVYQKELYVHHTLDSLINNLPANVNRYILLVSNKPGVYSGLYLILNQKVKDNDQKQIYITVTFSNPISRQEVTKAGLQKLQGLWGIQARKLFQSRTISEVDLVEN